MAQYTLLVDDEMCFNCKACEVACKQENNIPVGVKRISVVQLAPEKVGGRIVTSYIPVACKHCEDAPCVAICPSGALTKRADGIVVRDADLCIGCKSCILACPFSAIGINPQTGAAEKCNLCVQRIEVGLPPACVKTCEGGAIYFGDANEIAERLKKDRAERRRLKAMI